MGGAPALRAWAGVLLLLAACGPDAVEPDVSDSGAFVALDSALDGPVDHGLVLSGTYALPEIMGSGIALVDLDGDGVLELYQVRAGRSPTEGAADRIWRRTADGTYRSEPSPADGYGMGVAVGDYDGDGDDDVFVTNWGRDRLLRNDGGRLIDVTAEAGVGDDGWGTSATFTDVDRDGDLDLFVARYVDVDPLRHCTDAAGRREYCTPSVFPPLHDLLWRNEGDGTFTDVSAELGLAAGPQPGLGVGVADLTGDGRDDLFVANDGAPNQLWTWDGDRLRDVAPQWGVAFNAMGESEAGMGVVVMDLGADGRFDLHLTHLGGETDTLYTPRGERIFGDTTAGRGLADSSLGRTGFGSVAGDFDHDGDLDLVVVNGRVAAGEVPAGATGPLAAYAEVDQLLLQGADGRFVEAPAGDLGAVPAVSRGLAAGDLDGDGDPDLVVGTCGGPLRVLRNDLPASDTHWLQLDVRDAAGRRAVGAVVRIVWSSGGRERSAVRRVDPTHGYLSASAGPVHVGLGPAKRFESVLVRWSDGVEERFPGGAADRRIELRRGGGE